ncbi:cilia- and flagella-associated protein 47 [Bufo bufo]|uniref:cilia- and flagella-associated protein 47 n=1 Tax=Bufo bufo TaxID=8384 RepID=UPI001ABED506|nr:cilia- and flagella-associated protein 47 [Bufo bufo]
MEELLDKTLGVRIAPGLLHFMDVFVGRTYQANISVQNISHVAKAIKIHGASDPQFTLYVQNPEKPVAPGLQVTASVEYRPSKKEDIHDKLLVVVDNDVIEVPLLGFTPSCCLEIDPEVNFGDLVANSKVIYKEIAVTNHGSSPGTFKIKYSGHFPITISPTSGIVEPKKMQIIKVDLCTDIPSVFEETAKVKLQGHEEQLLKIKGNIVNQNLELLDLSGKPLKCLHFGSVYFGTSKIHKAVIYNDSPETISWVSVLDDNAVGAELGTNILESTDAALQDMDYRTRMSDREVSSILTCCPNEGVLLPFQKTTFTVCFSPKQFDEAIRRNDVPSQQDYALFMRFEPIGSKDGFLQSDADSRGHRKGQQKGHVELAVTGSAFPVALTFSPGTVYNFKECLIGERIDIHCSLKNESQFLPAVFSFHKISHFHISPANGKIEAGRSQEVMFSFVPHQGGTFNVKQVVDILGPTSDDNLPPLKMKAFHQKKLSFTAVCKPLTKKIVMKINPGITPMISNPTGHFVQVAPQETAVFTGSTRAATLKADKVQIHDHQNTSCVDKNVMVAFPNDRAASIRPSDRNTHYRTIFTKVERYNYVDPDYAYTEDEEKLKEAHKDYYTNYIKNRRENRLQEENDREFQEVSNDFDIGITPAAGFQTPSTSVFEHFNKQRQTKSTPMNKGRMLTTRQLAAEESTSITREINEGLNALPHTATEKEDCSLILTPQQLHHVVIGPSSIDFGEVCVNSTSVKEMNIINSLPTYIWVQVEIDCDELQQTSPLSHVVPPMSKTEIPVVFETNTLGKFKKSISYTVNNKHIGCILVTARAVPIALELSSHELVLKPNNDFLAETGFRSSIRLYNRRNHAAEFSWKPIITEKGIAFSIRPARGIVDAYEDLECEVVWHPGFSSPDVGELNLCVQRSTHKLKCIAELGSTNVQFTEQRILFHRAPLGLSTIKTAIIQNTGANHAYFQVVDISPLPGMTITPSQGVVPVGGHAALTIFFTPRAVIKFDTRIEVSVRNAKTLALRIGGSVVPPEVDISVSSFLFPGVYVNSTQAIPFMLQNKGVARARVEFDLSKYEDFYLTFKEDAAVEVDPLYPQLYTLDLEEKEALECSLHFSPKEVAAYDFQLPVNINFTGGLSDADSSAPVTPTHSEKHIVIPRPQLVNVITPACKVNATVLQQILRLSTNHIAFELPSGVFDLGIADDTLSSQVFELSNISKKRVSWRFNLDQTLETLKNGIFKFSKRSGALDPGETNRINVYFCPDKPGNYTAEIPVILNDNPDTLFIPLHLFGSSKKPVITFDPPLVILTPVPLDTEVEAVVDVMPANYNRSSILKVEIPEVELENSERKKVFSVYFPNGQTISGSSHLDEKIVCKIAFKSPTPVSCLADLLFTDEYNNQFRLQVAAVAENCILTAYPYLAYHRTDQVILKSGHNGNNGKNGGMAEAVLRPCHIPETPSQSTSSSSLGAVTSSTYEESVSEDDNMPGNERTQTRDEENQYEGIKSKLELSFYPEEDSEEWMFYRKVLTTVQTWFSLFGWASGCNPITIPQSLWSGVCKVKLSKSEGKAPKTINLGKQTKTIYDMLFYLSGQMLPGITASQSLPSDPTERVLQLHWQHATLLTFLKNQGASLSHIKPEYLFEPLDYERWMQVQVQIQKLQHLNEKTADHMEINLLHLNNSVFQSVSKRVWTDILLQIYKVFILSRVTQRKNDDDNVIDCMPKISSEPLSSNIYSTSEIILLTWLNVHYEKMRKVAWRNCKKGDIPPTRWIMNFDKDLLDGLVLAAQVAAYCPYLILTHFISMYTNPETPEQCLHNCLILVSAFRVVGLNIDIQATDICDPNPVTMLMLCVYLHENLPLYVPKKTITFDGALHQTISRQVRLKNPSSKPLTYQATIVGRESADFLLPKENTIKIAPKSQVDVTVEYKSRFLHPAEATMLLAAKPISGAGGTTLSFSLQSRLTDLAPTVQLKQESPCYELEKICLSVESPYKRHGKFRVILLESSNHLQFPTFQDEITKLKDEKSSSMNSTDHDLSTMICDSNNQDCKSNLLRQYFCPVNSIFLKNGMSTNLQVNFLPFELGKRYCAIIFTNEEIGDFVYMIEGMGTPPLPSTVTPVISPNVFQMKNGNTDAQNICYFKCKENSRLEEDLKIPLVNERREKALALAAQMQMTLLEYERRKVTGTLESSSLRAAVASSGGNCEEIKASLRSSSFSSTSKKCQTIDYDVEISMAQYFKVPRKISIPVSTRNRVTAKSVSVEGEQDQDKEKGVLLPVKFFPEKPGRYTCKILLRSYHDVRVYMIECVVNPCSTETELEFITPACEALIQDIPICNMTQQDWKLKAILQVDRFYGPPFLYIPAGETAQYPLLFKPTVECCSMGTLILQNETDGTEHIFGLRGIGQEPLALDHIVIDCQVRQITQKVLMVPNYTNDRLTFKVASDIPIIGGSQTLTIKPGTSSPFTLSISPWKRGLFQGVISFVAGDGEQQYQCGNPPVSADGTEAVQIDDIQIANAGIAGRESAPYKVWFSVEINSMPAPPERTIDVTCSVLKSVGVNIPITNPTMDVLNFHVLVNGDGITGDDVFTLQPRETFSYVAKFSPTKTGSCNGSVIFQCEAFGEFWYNLVLTAEKPDSVTIPEVFCELGKWMRLSLPLVNSTQETYELYAVNSNPEHFLVELDGSKPLSIPPNSTTEVPVQFCPSSLGKGSQTTSIAFKNPQLEEWTFHLSGVGLIPQPMEPASLSTNVGSLASINISFKNPTNENVLVDVILTDQEQTMHRLSASVLRHSINKEPAFCLPLKQTQGIPLFAKEKLDIPVLFAPDTMKLYEALVVVHMVKADGDNWDHGNFEDISTELKSISKTEDGDISGIRWIYPIHGIPEAQPSNFAPAVVSCQARCRTEERVEVLLTGVAPGQTAMPASSQNLKPMERTMAHVQEEVQVSNGFRTTEEFLYEIRYESEESKSHLEPSVGIELVRKERDTPSGIVTLIFNIIFAPNKSMRHSALLVVQCVTGGIWKFPIHFVATEPNVDDVIQIEAVGLNKESAVGFRLTSHTRYPEPFSAYFIQGSDLEFSVSPQSGELLPLGTAGTLITVGFKPSMYSKKHRATLVVQSSSMQWTYEINGLPPKTTPPTNVSPKICSLGMRKSMTCQKRNFLRENLKLTTTAVSSPVKGASLMFSTK